MAYKEFREKIVRLQSDVDLFKVEFLDRDEFKRFADDLWSNVSGWRRICITGYFSETIRKSLESINKMPSYALRLICPHLDSSRIRDRKNIQALKKMAEAGVEIKINNRLHARFLVAYDIVQEDDYTKYQGLVLIGSFDFNTECLGRERYDAGIKTRNPDLVKSTVELFEQIWNEAESIDLEEFNKRGKS